MAASLDAFDLGHGRGDGFAHQGETLFAAEERGRQVYLRDGCWQCHSQYIRPVTGETARWGPVSQTGEYAYDRPHMFSTRRIGPDLTRVGRSTATIGMSRICGIRKRSSRTA